MDNMVKKNVLIIGKGSIGKRHSKLFMKIGCKVFFYRSDDKNIFLKKKYDLICICNPSALHFKTFKKFKDFSKNFLFEKPAACKEKDINNIKKIAKNENIQIFSGYMLRHDPKIILIKKKLKKLKLRYSNFVWQSYLPDWHPWEDYRNSYASQKKLGGGVLFTCSHEIDLANFLFGKVKKVFCTETLSNISTDVENSVLIILEHQSGVKSNLVIDFSSTQKQRFFEIYSDEKSMRWDFVNDKIKIKEKDKIKYLRPSKNSNISKIYYYQDKYIFESLSKKKTQNFKNFFHTEEIIFSAFKSLKSKRFELVK